MNKNISKKKLFLALISLIITFFVWQQGLRDSLSRPSVSFDITQKEKEITELALPVVPTNFKKNFITNNPFDEIINSLSAIPFDELTERNKFIWIIAPKNDEKNIINEYLNSFENNDYKSVLEILSKNSEDNSYKPNYDLLDSFKGDRFLSFPRFPKLAEVAE